MRTFLFQCSALMMVTLVYSCPIHNCTNSVCIKLLQQIRAEANHLSKEVPNNIWVPKISSGDKKCVPHFFCLAEKVVKGIINRQVKLSHLHEQLVEYNKLTNDTHCKVNPNNIVELPDFLEDVVDCVDSKIKKRA